MNTLVIYIQKRFLVAYFEWQEKILHDMLHDDLAEKYLFVHKLIKKVGAIYLDIDQKEIEHLILKDTNRFSDSFEFYFKQLVNAGVAIKQCPIDLNNAYDILNIKGKRNQPHYLLLDCDADTALRYEKTIGIICIPTSLKINKEIYSVVIKPIEHLNQNNLQKKTTKFQLNKYVKYCNQSHSIIIEDPYIHAINVKYLKELLASFYDHRFRNNPLHIQLVGQSFQPKKPNKNDNPDKIKESNEKLKKAFEKKVETFKIFLYDFNETYKGKIRVDFDLIHNTKMHDRNILSNSFWIVCGHSFKDSYDTNTEWQYRPIGTYFPQFKKRIQFINLALKSNIQLNKIEKHNALLM